MEFLPNKRWRGRGFDAGFWMKGAFPVPVCQFLLDEKTNPEVTSRS